MEFTQRFTHETRIGSGRYLTEKEGKKGTRSVKAARERPAANNWVHFPRDDKRSTGQHDFVSLLSAVDADKRYRPPNSVPGNLESGGQEKYMVGNARFRLLNSVVQRGDR